MAGDAWRWLLHYSGCCRYELVPTPVGQAWVYRILWLRLAVLVTVAMWTADAWIR